MRQGRIQNVFCFYFIRFCDSIWALVLQNYNFILLGIHVEDGQKFKYWGQCISKPLKTYAQASESFKHAVSDSFT